MSRCCPRAPSRNATAIHAVVNNAGIHDDAPMARMRDAQWHRLIDVSLHGLKR